MNKYLEKIAARVSVKKGIMMGQDAFEARDGISSQFKARNKTQKKKKPVQLKGPKFNRRTMRKSS